MREEKDGTEKDIPNEIEHFVLCCDYRRRISETKKVSHRIASGIPVFALPPLLLLFPIFLRLNESLVSRLQRFSASLLSHPHRDFFFPLSLNGHS